jgi:hypothetical protein
MGRMLGDLWRRHDSRACAQILTPPSNGGAVCPKRRRPQACSSSCCPQDCMLSNWSSWGACNATCGQEGTQTRTRSVVVAQSCGGGKCDSATMQSQQCNNATSCCPRDCVLNGWSPVVGVLCNVRRWHAFRARAPKQLADELCGGSCPAQSESEPCNTRLLPNSTARGRLHGQWSACSVTCGAGRQTRSRTVQTSANVWRLLASARTATNRRNAVRFCRLACSRPSAVPGVELVRCGLTCSATCGASATKSRTRTALHERRHTAARHAHC